MDYNTILTTLREKLKGSYDEDAKMLREEGEKFAHEGNEEGIRAIGALMNEIMPAEQKAEIERLTHIDGIRLDEFHQKIVELINKKEKIEAKSLAEKLYLKITEEYCETDTAKFVSLRNLFEDNLYYLLYNPQKTLNRSPFDFATFITTYAYILIDTGSTLDAIPILQKAMEYNPLDCGPKFELAEVYKLLKNKKKLIEVTQETLKVASSPVAIARCYANMGYICFDIGEYDDAVAFYTASVKFAPHPAVPMELKGIAERKGTPIIPPTHEQILAVMKKYDIEFGPDKRVIEAAAQLASNLLIKKDIPNALNALKLLYNLTRDDKIRDMILKYEPNAPQFAPRKEGKPEITRTVNENPEE